LLNVCVTKLTALSLY